MILSAITTTVLKAGELFLSGCITGGIAYRTVRNILSKEE